MRRLQGRFGETSATVGTGYPDYATIVNNIGRMAYAAKDFDKARRCFERTLLEQQKQYRSAAKLPTGTKPGCACGGSRAAR